MVRNLAVMMSMVVVYGGCNSGFPRSVHEKLRGVVLDGEREVYGWWWQCVLVIRVWWVVAAADVGLWWQLLGGGQWVCWDVSGGGIVLCLFGGFLTGFCGWHSGGVCGYGSCCGGVQL